MSIRVYRAFSIRDGHLIEDGPLPRVAVFTHGDVASVLTGLERSSDPTGPGWDLSIVVDTDDSPRREVILPLEHFLSLEEYQFSTTHPLSFERLTATGKAPRLDWLWLFRHTIYVCSRMPRPSEIDEVVLRIKALHFKRDSTLKRLKEQVANFEAVESHTRSATARKALPDDVKLAVWARDKGICIKCGRGRELHFDHIIPLSRGGSDTAKNIQLLCRTCNLEKGGRPT
jgi:hypothetical protein